jgi:hypothetical protein
MLLDDNFAWFGRELGPELATPRAVLEGLMRQRVLLNRRNILPTLVVARTLAMMHGIEDPELRTPGGLQHLQHMGNAVIDFCDGPNAGPSLAPFWYEIVIEVDH